MRRGLLVFMLLAVPLGAQEPKADAAAKPAAAPGIQKMFILKYADPESVRALLEAFGAGVRQNAAMRALAVTAPHTTMLAIEEAIARLDVPSGAPRNFDFTVDLVTGTDADNPVSADVPKDLDSVVAQLRGAFPFKNYRLLDVLTLQTRAGTRASTQSSSGVMRFGSATRTVNSDFAILSASLGADGTTVHLDGLKCQVIFPNENQSTMGQVALQTNIDIKEGQKVVVGRMGMNSQQALFVVLTVKVLQ